MSLVCQVWQDNLEDELELIRDIVDDYPYLAMGESQLHDASGM